MLKVILATTILFTAHSSSTAQTFDIDRTNMTCGPLEATLYAIDPLSCTVLGVSSTITIPLGSTTISYSTAALTALFPPLPPVWEIGAIDIFTPTSCTVGTGTSTLCTRDFMTVGNPNTPCGYTAADCMWSSPNPFCGTCVPGQVTQATFTSGTLASVALY